MNAEEIRTFCLEKRVVTEDFPFDQDTMVFKVGNKIFLLMSLEREPLSINLKADPEISIELRENYPQIKPGYHMNKNHWNTIVLDGLRADFVQSMIDDSYNLVFNSLTKKLQQELLKDI